MSKISHVRGLSCIDQPYYVGRKGKEVAVISTTGAFVGAGGVSNTTASVTAKQLTSGVTALTTGTQIALTSTAGDIFTLTPSTHATITCSDATAGMQKTIVVTAIATQCTLTFSTGFLVTGTLNCGTSAGKVFMLTLASATTVLNETGRTTAM